MFFSSLRFFLIVMLSCNLVLSFMSLAHVSAQSSVVHVSQAQTPQLNESHQIDHNSDARFNRSSDGNVSQLQTPQLIERNYENSAKEFHRFHERHRKHEGGYPSKGCALVLVVNIGGSLNQSEARWLEVKTTLASNSAFLGHDCIHIIQDTELPKYINPYEYSSHIKRWDKLPTWANLVQYVNKQLRPGQITAIANFDIILDPSSWWCNIDIPEKTVWALTRHPHSSCPIGSGGVSANMMVNMEAFFTSPNLCESAGTTADTFVFRTPFLPDHNYIEHVPPSSRGSERRLLCGLAAANYTVKNPCNCFKTFHLHCQKISGESRIPMTRLAEEYSNVCDEFHWNRIGFDQNRYGNPRTSELCLTNSCSPSVWAARELGDPGPSHAQKLFHATDTASDEVSMDQYIGNIKQKPRRPRFKERDEAVRKEREEKIAAHKIRYENNQTYLEIRQKKSSDLVYRVIMGFIFGICALIAMAVIYLHFESSD